MSALPHEGVNKSVESVLAQASEVAVLPQVVYKIIELTGNTSTAIGEIESAISIDPGFSSKVLLLANSAYYSLPRKMTSIREATTFLGFKTIRQLAMTVGVFDMFVGKADASSLRRRRWWRHSVDTAVCAQAVAKALRTVTPDEAYSCGLLHDVGKPLLDRATHANYEDVEKLIEAGIDVVHAERTVYGCSHVDVGAAAAQIWRFPEPLCESVAYHHSPPPGDCPRHVAVTALADSFAHAILSGRTGGDELALQGNGSWASEALCFSGERLGELYEICKEAIANGSGRI